MSKNLKDTTPQYTDEQRALIQKQREKWRSVNYAQTDSNLVKYTRQVAGFGRIHHW